MKAIERESARKMRACGCSVKDIEKELHVSRGSVSRWVRDIELTEKQKTVLKEKSKYWAGRSMGAQTNRDRAKRHRAEIRRTGFVRAKTDDVFRVICALYWGEGAKSLNTVASISNADVDILRLWGKWVVGEGYGDYIAFSVCYYGENGLSEGEIKKWWMDNLPFLRDINMRKFIRCVINRASQKKKIGRLPYGTGVMRICRRDLWEMLMGGIDYLRKCEL